MFNALKKKWFMLTKKANFKHTAETFNVSETIARMIRNRDVITDREIYMYLYGTEKDFFSPWTLKDMDKAVQLMDEKIRWHKKCRIIGDYDIDGVVSSYILTSGLKRLGVDCSVRIPHRIFDGYGVNEKMIQEAIDDGVDTIITCDNGIAAVNEFRLAKEHGMTVIITDHHEVPYEEVSGEKKYILPIADAIIDPKQVDCPYENKDICGAVLALKLITALYERHGIAVEEIREFYDVAAIATVGDVVDLKGENRIIVKEGLKRLPQTKNIGLQELIKAVKLNAKEVNSYHIGFVIGPCINASGRLETALLALKLLQTKNQEDAARIAEELVRLNETRKSMTEIAVNKAIDIIEQGTPLDPKNANTYGGIDRVLVVYLPECHESLAGIIAGRLRERYYRPAFVLTNGQNGVKGSGRSIDEYSMFDELVKCSDLLERFGGHPLAAGLSLKKDNIDAFRKLINEKCTLSAEDLRPKVVIDAETNLSAISFQLIEQLKILEPYGKSNMKPKFACRNLTVRNVKLLGKDKKVVRMGLTDSYGNSVDAICFENAEKLVADLGNRTKISAIVYYPSTNEYNGRVSLQAVITEYNI